MELQFEPRVLILAGDLLTRTGLAALLDAHDEFDVVGRAAGGDTLTSDLDVYRPDVVIYDLGYEPLRGLEDLSTLVDMAMTVIALLPDSDNASAILNVLKATEGGYGLLLRDSAADLLGESISAALAGLVVVEPDLIPALTPTTGGELPQPPAEALTPRELDVLDLLAQGLTNKAIGQSLGISPNTVKFHINAILGKLNAQSRTEAVVRATRLGWIIL